MSSILYEGIVPEGQKPVRLDHYLTGKYPKYSRNKIQKAIQESRLLVNGSTSRPNYLLKGFDHVKLISQFPSHGKILATEIFLDIIYEDREFLIINKMTGMAVHAGLGTHSNILLNAVAHHYLSTGQTTNLANGLVHRLDKGSSGLICIAKTRNSFQFLSNQFKNKEACRTYLALVWGSPAARGIIDLPIGRNPENKMQIMVDQSGLWGKSAITRYITIENLEHCSLIECKLETGRTHQIRVHLHHLGHPLLGDKRYPASHLIQPIQEKLQEYGISSQLLHASGLELTHPITMEKVTFSAPLPSYFSSLLSTLKLG